MSNTLQQSVITLLGIDKMPLEQQNEVMTKIGGIIYQGILSRALETLPEEKQVEFEKLTDNNVEPDELFSFLTANVPTFQQIVEEEVKSFTGEVEHALG